MNVSSSPEPRFADFEQSTTALDKAGQVLFNGNSSCESLIRSCDVKGAQTASDEDFCSSRLTTGVN